MANEDENLPVALLRNPEMVGNVELTNTKGLLVRQDAVPLECFLQSFGCCYVNANAYQMIGLPEDKFALRGLKDIDGWRPTQKEIDETDYTLLGQEKSSCCVRSCLYACRCSNFRPFEMNFNNKNGENIGLKLEKPFTCGGVFCFPHSIDVRLNGKYVGKVEEDWNINNWCERCCEFTLCCNVPYKLKLATGDHEYENRFDINVSLCIWGPHNNCCGSSPCCNDILFEAYKDKGKEVEYDAAVGWLQKTFGNSCGFTACSRWLCCNSANYIIEWPQEATAEDRALFVGATILLDYVLYEK